jgi:23S rRNA (guanosine2251-2'-O)-methyltransferase
MKTCVLILDNIRSVENAGSIFRTSEGLGVSKIYLVGTTPAPIDRFGRKRTDFAKVSLGAEDLMEWEYIEKIDSLIKELKDQNFKILALEQSENSIDLKDFSAPEQFALILGNEVEGISKETLDKCDKIIEIDMKGEKESLNVSVSAGIALYQLLKLFT